MSNAKKYIVLVYANSPVINPEAVDYEYRLLGGLYIDITGGRRRQDPPIADQEGRDMNRYAKAYSLYWPQDSRLHRLRFSHNTDAAQLFSTVEAMDQAIVMWKKSRMWCRNTQGTMKYRLRKVVIRPDNTTDGIILGEVKHRKTFDAVGVASTTMHDPLIADLTKTHMATTFKKDCPEGLYCMGLGRYNTPRQQKLRLEAMTSNKIHIIHK